MKQNKKQTIKLTETQLRQVIKESVKRVLNESNEEMEIQDPNIEKLIKGLEGNFAVRRNDLGGLDIYGYEPYFNGRVLIAYYSPKMKCVYPAHGYSAPHRHGSLLARICKTLGIAFNND